MARLAGLCIWWALFAATIHAQDTPSAPELYVYTLDKYFGPAVVTQFKKRHGCTVHVDRYGDDQALLDSFEESGYDVITTSAATAAELKARERLLRLDHGALPNLERLLRLARDFHPGSDWTYSVPFSRTASDMRRGGGNTEVFAISARTPVACLAHHFINHIHDPEMTLLADAGDAPGRRPGRYPDRTAASLAFDYQ